MWSEAATRVGTLTVRHPPGAATRPSPTALRLAVSGQLAAADLSPVGVPPSVVLVVRRLADPRPRSLASRPGTVRTDPAWESAVRSRLAELHRFAARPADGSVPPSAAAVCFRDRAEMLACLARDLVVGSPDAWWWRSLRRELPDELPRLLAEHPRELPAIIARLVEIGALLHVASTLDRSDATKILSSMVAAHRLDPSLVPAGEALARPTEPPPWARWQPPAGDAGQTPEHSAFLGVALGLAHRPVEIRSARFAAEVRGWWRRAGARAAARDPANSSASPGRVDGDDSRSAERSAAAMSGAPVPMNRVPMHRVPGTSREATQNVAVGFGNTGADAVERSKSNQMSSEDSPSHPQKPENPTATRDDPSRNSAGADESGALEASDFASESRIAGRSNPSEARRARDAATGAAQAEDGGSARSEGTIEWEPEPVDDSEPASAADPTEALADGVDTALGGVLYLINALPHVYQDDAADGDGVWTRSENVGGWGVLELVARGLLDDGAENVGSDPIWRALAVLDGHEPGEVPEREPWLDDLLPALRIRLAEALAEDASNSWRPALATDLFAVPGRLYVTRTHVDLVAPLNHISLAVRRAGLDRDPGWVPELSRVVLFHFR